MIFPGAGLSSDSTLWVTCRPGFFLHVQVLSRLFCRLFLDGFLDLHRSGNLIFFGDHAWRIEVGTLAAWLAPFHKLAWVVRVNCPIRLTREKDAKYEFG